MYVLRVQVGSSMTTHKLLCAGRTVQTAALAATPLAASAGGLAKSLAIADTLRYTRRGYSDGMQVVRSHAQSNVVLYMVPVHSEMPAKVERVQATYDRSTDMVNALISHGWLNSNAQLASGVRLARFPAFDAADPLNAVRSMQPTQARSFAWNLLKGNGTKRVWAEVRCKDGSVYTLSDVIEIAPYSISVAIDTTVPSTREEFVIVVLMKGKYFGDTRVMVSGGRLLESGGLAPMGTPVISYFDWWQPAMYLDKSAAGFLTNGSVVQTDFSYALNCSPSVQDQGRANIAKVELVIARKPSDLTWTIDPTGRATTAETLSPEYVYSMRNEVHPFALPVTPSSYTQAVRWDISGVSDWASGDYIMGIVTEDEFGNRGWAPFLEMPTPSLPLSNPWLIDVQPGR